MSHPRRAVLPTSPALSPAPSLAPRARRQRSTGAAFFAGAAAADGAPLTPDDVRRVLARAQRRLAPRGVPVVVVFESVRLLPPRPGRAGTDVPAGCGGCTVHPARVRYAVHRAAPGGGAAAPGARIQATYRLWRDTTGRWGFTGPLADGAWATGVDAN